MSPPPPPPPPPPPCFAAHSCGAAQGRRTWPAPRAALCPTADRTSRGGVNANAHANATATVTATAAATASGFAGCPLLLQQQRASGLWRRSSWPLPGLVPALAPGQQQQQQQQRRRRRPAPLRRARSIGTSFAHPRRVAPTAAIDAMPFVNEALELLAATAIVVPLFRRFRLSPILGFLVAGVVLGPHGFRLVKDVEDITELAEFGVLFLLFEMGLQLNIDRLRKLRKYAFGMGTLQVTLTALVLGLGAYAMDASIPEAAVIGTALSLSSSAFILQLLAEKGERQSRAGVAVFGVLLLQDIAVVPLLVLVPFLGSSMWLSPGDMGPVLVAGARHVGSTLAVLNVVVLGGGFVLRKVFGFVAESKSAEAFTSTVLLTVLGTAWLTDELGLSMTLGSFIAGVLLAESSFRSRIMVDTEPFRGLFLGLFFITTGMSMDLSLWLHAPGKMMFLVSSLLFWKTIICTLTGLPVGLSLAESLRVGLLIGQGGEFAFVLFAIANKLGFLPNDVNAYLVTTVVTSMALTPALYELGLWLAPRVDKIVESSGGQPTAEVSLLDVGRGREAFVMVFGYGPVGQVVGRMLSRKFIRWVAVDIDMDRVRTGMESNKPVIYGDSVHPTELLHANNLPTPSAFVVTHSTGGVLEDCLAAVRSAFPDRPVYVRASDVTQQKRLLGMGALALFPETLETSLSLGAAVLSGFGTSASDLSAIKKELRQDGDVEEAFAEYERYWAESLRDPSDDVVSVLELDTPGENRGAVSASAESNGAAIAGNLGEDTIAELTSRRNKSNSTDSASAPSEVEDESIRSGEAAEVSAEDAMRSHTKNW